MFKTILLFLLAGYFILNGINHFMNEKMLEEYARGRHMISPRLAVLAAGVLLVFGGAALLIPSLLKAGVICLSVFLLIAAFSIRSFWVEKERMPRLYEAMNFTKNIAILTELLYIGFA